MKSRELVDEISKLINVASGASLPCDQPTGTPSCVGRGSITWGRPLTKREYASLCPACRAYWHLSAARNDVVEYIRTGRAEDNESDDKGAAGG